MPNDSFIHNSWIIWILKLTTENSGINGLNGYCLLTLPAMNAAAHGSKQLSSQGSCKLSLRVGRRDSLGCLPVWLEIWLHHWIVLKGFGVFFNKNTEKKKNFIVHSFGRRGKSSSGSSQLVEALCWTAAEWLHTVTAGLCQPQLVTFYLQTLTDSCSFSVSAWLMKSCCLELELHGLRCYPVWQRWKKGKPVVAVWGSWLCWKMVAFSSLLRISGECSTIHPQPALFFFFLVEISSRKWIPLFRPGSVHSGSASLDNCDGAFPDELHELDSW